MEKALHGFNLFLYVKGMDSQNTVQTTFVMLKPDAVLRGLSGRIISRFEQCGLQLMALKMCNVSPQMAEQHYEEHRGKSFFTGLVNLLGSGPVIIMAVKGAHAIELVRKLVGNTEPLRAMPGTIRGDFCHMGYARSRERLGVIPNLIHASDSPESAERELAFWFSENDYAETYKRCESVFM